MHKLTLHNDAIRQRALSIVQQAPEMTPSDFIDYTIAHATGDSCVAWPFCKSGSGYGQIYKNGKMIGAHVESLIRFSGEDRRADRMCACHQPVVCHNRICINPHHLRWGSYKENIADKSKDGTKRIGSKLHNSKLSEADVLEIYSMDESRASIGRKFGVSAECISHIKLGKTWAWLTGHGAGE